MDEYDARGLADPSQRARLSPAARRAADRLRLAWALSDEQFDALVGTTSADGGSPMSEDQLRRVGLLVGIYADLHRLHTADLADAWVTRPNTNAIFGGRSPVDAMVHGGLQAIAAVAELLVGRVAGS